MLTHFAFMSLEDFEAASSKAGKVEAEVKRLHTLIVDINSHKLKAQQDKLDQINAQLDECSSSITKAQVAIKTAGRSVHWLSSLPLCCVCSFGIGLKHLSRVISRRSPERASRSVNH